MHFSREGIEIKGQGKSEKEKKWERTDKESCWHRERQMQKVDSQNWHIETVVSSKDEVNSLDRI